MSATFLQPLLSRARRAELQLVDMRTDQVLAVRVELAADATARRSGLLGREGIGQHDALVIAPCAAVHTCSMRFAIDVVFAARDGRVLAVRSDVGPWRVAAAWRAFAAIELAAGSAVRCGVRAGDQLAWRIAAPDTGAVVGQRPEN